MPCTALIQKVVTECLEQSYSQYTQLWLSVLHSLIPNAHSCDRVSFTVLFPIHTVVTECLLQSYSQYTQLWQSVFHSLIPNTHSCDWVSCTVLFPIHTVVTECLLQSYSQYTQLWLSVLHSLIPNTHKCNWVSCTVLFPIHTFVTECLAQSYSQYTQLWQSVHSREYHSLLGCFLLHVALFPQSGEPRYWAKNCFENDAGESSGWYFCENSRTRRSEPTQRKHRWTQWTKMYVCGGVYVPCMYTHALPRYSSGGPLCTLYVHACFAKMYLWWSLCTLYVHACLAKMYLWWSSYLVFTRIPCQDVPLVEFMYLVFTRMPGESYRRRLRS